MSTQSDAHVNKLPTTCANYQPHVQITNTQQMPSPNCDETDEDIDLQISESNNNDNNHDSNNGPPPLEANTNDNNGANVNAHVDTNADANDQQLQLYLHRKRGLYFITTTAITQHNKTIPEGTGGQVIEKTDKPGRYCIVFMKPHHNMECFIQSAGKVIRLWKPVESIVAGWTRSEFIKIISNVKDLDDPIFAILSELLDGLEECDEFDTLKEYVMQIYETIQKRQSDNDIDIVE